MIAPGAPSSEHTCSAPSGAAPPLNTDNRRSTVRSVSPSRSQLQSTMARSVWCCGSAALLPTDSRANLSSRRSWPLYLWEGDTAAGQATGQADDMGLWYVLSVNGTVDRGTPTS